MIVTSAIKIKRIQLQYILKKLTESSFIRNFLVVMTGTAGAQAIGFAMSPIISRLYTPADFGVFGSFNAILSVMTAAVTLNYAQAMMLPKKNEEAINLFVLSCGFSVLIAICCLVLFLLAPNYLKSLMKTQNPWLPLLLVFGTALSGLNESLQSWCVRVKAFKDTSASQVVRSLTSNGSQVGIGFWRGGPFALVFGTILGEMLASLNLARVMFRGLGGVRREISWERIRMLAKDYKDFPIYGGSKDIINAISLGLPVLLLTHFYGIVVAGAYAFGIRILQIPMGFVTRSLQPVLFQKASESFHQDDSLVSLYKKTTAGLFVLAFFPLLVLFLWAPQIFAWIFGSQWYNAGEFAAILTLWILVGFCNLPAVLFARLIRIQRFLFFYDLALLGTRTFALLFGGYYLSALQTIMFFSLVGSAMNVFLIFFVGKAVKDKEMHTDLGNIRDNSIN